jgi:predicted CoA-binding protein
MSKKTLVFGASLKETRYSYLAIQKLLKHRQEVVAYGLRQGKIVEIIIDTELKLYTKIDTITLYMNPVRQEEYYDYLISLKPNRILFNPGTENPEFYKLLKQHNIKFEEACTLVLLSTNQY